MLFESLFSSSLLVSIIILTITSSLLILTTQRRLTDANLNKKWRLYPNSFFILIALIIIWSNNPVTHWLLLLPLVSFLFLLTYKSEKKLNYILGYYGPIDLSSYYTNQRVRRIEPSFTSTNNIPHTVEHSSQTQQYTDTTLSHDAFDLGGTIRNKLFSKKSAQTVLLTVFGLVFMIIVSIILISEPEVPEGQVETKNTPEKLITSATKYENKITLPDDFSLLTNQYSGIVINWPADLSDKDILWDINSGIGDKTCQNVTFNNGDEIRTLRVEIEDSEHYFAVFSPLDSAQIIKNIALRSNFSLCGYHFSLKGSQAVLSKNSYYAGLIN